MIASDLVAGQASPVGTPRPVLWLILAACAAASAAVGIVATVVILGGIHDHAAWPATFWLAIAGGAVMTCASLGVRTLRWIFLLRRASTRVPLRDACIGYLAGFSLLFVPLLVGEIFVRSAINRSRARTPLATTAVVNLWERLLDASALAFIAAVAAARIGGIEAAIIPLTIVALTATQSFRRVALSTAAALANAVVRRIAPADRQVTAADFSPLTGHATWLSAFSASVVAWLLPPFALWGLARNWSAAVTLADAQLAYASSALTGGILLAPGGIRVVGSSLLTYLHESGLTASDAAMTVFFVRLVTAGVATAVGAIVVGIHLKTRALARETHFDDIAHAYDAQIPRPQRDALLARKTTMMRDALERWHIGRRGLDVGCGQGWYVARMREMGLDVHGIDPSAGQISLARRHVENPSVIAEGTALRIDARDAAYDFAYCINVLHHLATVDEQRAAFSELFRVVKPGGLVFVHEINTRNLLFRFYMGYVFPSLNCIDEGTERWLLPHRMSTYTTAPVVGAEYFTFMPDFVPGFILRLFRPIESALETSPLRVFSAHYMAVLQKPGAGA